MSRIKEAFENKKAFIGFLTAGDPNLEKTAEFICEMDRAGADLIEIGIPFSDPTAEGLVIQEANIRSLAQGTNVTKIFEMVKEVRTKVSAPLAFMTYLNPVYYYGYEAFFAKCKEVQIDGIIIPDLPFEEKKEVSEVANKYGVEVISLIAPTSDERIKMIAGDAQGFIYMVSSMGVTGVRNQIQTDLEDIIKAVKSSTDLPVAVGFGIHTAEQAKNISQIADGVIVGSAIVKLIEKYKEDAGIHVYNYIKQIKMEMNG